MTPIHTLFSYTLMGFLNSLCRSRGKLLELTQICLRRFQYATDDDFKLSSETERDLDDNVHFVSNIFSQDRESMRSDASTSVGIVKKKPLSIRFFNIK